MTTLAAIVRRHCPRKLTLAGFVEEAYGVRERELRNLCAGIRRPSAALLARIDAYHRRHFPGDIVHLSVAGLVVVLGLPAPTNNPELN